MLLGSDFGIDSPHVPRRAAAPSDISLAMEISHDIEGKEGHEGM